MNENSIAGTQSLFNHLAGSAQPRGQSAGEAFLDFVRRLDSSASDPLTEAASGSQKTKNGPTGWDISDALGIGGSLPAWNAPASEDEFPSFQLGNKTVYIHPDVLERMTSDPNYAAQVFQRLEEWISLDSRHGSGSAQSITIGEDGQISSGIPLGRAAEAAGNQTKRKENNSFWDKRLARHKFFMKLWEIQQLKHKRQVMALDNAMVRMQMIRTGSTGNPFSTGSAADIFRWGNLLDANLAALFGAEDAETALFALIEEETTLGVPENPSLFSLVEQANASDSPEEAHLDKEAEPGAAERSPLELLLDQQAERAYNKKRTNQIFLG